MVDLKGKGHVQTYFVVAHSVAGSFVSQAPSDSGLIISKKMRRLIAWNVEILSVHLRKVVARRMAVKGKRVFNIKDLVVTSKDRKDKTCLDEMQDVMSMPAFDPKTSAKEASPENVDLGEKVMNQLHSYVEAVAHLYQNNPCKCF